MEGSERRFLLGNEEYVRVQLKSAYDLVLKAQISHGKEQQVKCLLTASGTIRECLKLLGVNTPMEPSGDEKERLLKQALEGIQFLTRYFKVQEGVLEYGSRILSAYDDFMSRVEDEFSALACGHVEGREYVLRSNMLLFALMMARVYVQVFGRPDSLDMVNRYIERAKKLA
jgi:hypothetical protein